MPTVVAHTVKLDACSNFYRESVWCAAIVVFGYALVVAVTGRYVMGTAATMLQALLVALPTAMSSPGVTMSNIVDSGATSKRAGKVGWLPALSVARAFLT